MHGHKCEDTVQLMTWRQTR